MLMLTLMMLYFKVLETSAGGTMVQLKHNKSVSAADVAGFPDKKDRF